MHISLLCHLAHGESDFPAINGDEEKANRKLTNPLGLPTNGKLIARDNPKCVAKTKTRKCTLRHKTSIGYNRRKIINLVKTKHNAKKDSTQKEET